MANYNFKIPNWNLEIRVILNKNISMYLGITTGNLNKAKKQKYK